MKTVLFDMDGTLTEARKPIKSDMVECINNLSKFANIGIVTGSPKDYIVEQLKLGTETWDADTLRRITYYPCNGTQVYAYDKFLMSLEEKSSVTIKDYLETVGNSDLLYAHMIMNLLDLQSHAIKTYKDLNPIGHFISYRGSLVNWSMVGREATHEDREAFVRLDKKLDIRKNLRSILRHRFDVFGLETIEMALGGSTSIDIYPSGWDKTYVLNHVDEKDAWFFGDKCEPGGNDHALYEKLRCSNRSFKVKSPDETIKKVKILMNQLEREENEFNTL